MIFQEFLFLRQQFGLESYGLLNNSLHRSLF